MRLILVTSDKCVGAEYKYTLEPDISRSELLFHHPRLLDLCVYRHLANTLSTQSFGINNEGY